MPAVGVEGAVAAASASGAEAANSRDAWHCVLQGPLCVLEPHGEELLLHLCEPAPAVSPALLAAKAPLQHTAIQSSPAEAERISAELSALPCFDQGMLQLSSILVCVQRGRGGGEFGVCVSHFPLPFQEEYAAGIERLTTAGTRALDHTGSSAPMTLADASARIVAAGLGLSRNSRVSPPPPPQQQRPRAFARRAAGRSTAAEQQAPPDESSSSGLPRWTLPSSRLACSPKGAHARVLATDPTGAPACDLAWPAEDYDLSAWAPRGVQIFTSTTGGQGCSLGCDGILSSLTGNLPIVRADRLLKGDRKSRSRKHSVGRLEGGSSINGENHGDKR